MAHAHSRETGGMLNKGDQASFVLCTSLYALALKGEVNPTRKRVLTYIRLKKLIVGEFVDVFMSWCREDSATSGLLAYRGIIDQGFWRLSESGRTFAEKRIDKWTSLEKTAEHMLRDLRGFQHECIYSLAFLELVLELGKKRRASAI
jgi:hypothetical protein